MSIYFRLLLTLLIVLTISNCTPRSLEASFSDYAWHPHDYQRVTTKAKVTRLELNFDKSEVNEAKELYPYLGQSIRDTYYQGKIRDYFIQEMRRAWILTRDASDDRVLKCRLDEARSETLKNWNRFRWFPLYFITIFYDFPELRVTLRVQCEVSDQIRLTDNAAGEAFAKPYQDPRLQTRIAYERAIDKVVFQIVSRLSERLHATDSGQ